MPQCCRCNGKGKCLNCTCKKSGMKCTDCLPSKKNQCKNLVTSDISNSSGNPNSGLSSTFNPPPVQTSASPPPAEITFGPATSQTDVTSPSFTPTQPPPRPTPRLPLYKPATSDDFRWGDKPGEVFRSLVNDAYSEIVHWKPNLFKVPTGKAGNQFVEEMNKLLLAFANKSAMEDIALKTLMLMPAMLLQKPYSQSKSSYHTKCLKDRMSDWKQGNLDKLLEEGRTIQQRKHTTTKSNKKNESLARQCANYLEQGNVKSALRLLSNCSNSSKGSLPLSQTLDDGTTVKQRLLQLHPIAQPVLAEAVTTRMPATPTHPVIYEEIDGNLIKSVTLKINGSAGPSGLDSAAWKRACCSFGRFSVDLCDAISRVARKISATIIDPDSISALLASRLIALDKCPGIRPIGVTEVLRRIISKAVLKAVTPDVQQAVGGIQLCIGQANGCEAGVHLMRKLYDDDGVEGILLVDACNAFNNLNRQMALRNIQIICPAIATILLNIYRNNASLFIDGETIHSCEGTTQGDPLAMYMYALASLPLIESLPAEVQQIWFADDAGGGGKLKDLKRWWETLVENGPKYGYYPNPMKSYLVVKDDCLDEATAIFRDSNINITKEGRNYLGSPIGTSSFIEEFVKAKISGWMDEIEVLSQIARSQPQAALSLLTHGITSKWSYLMRTVNKVAPLFQPLEEAIRHKLLPNITGRCDLNDLEQSLLILPAKRGGLGIPDVIATANLDYHNSVRVTSSLTKLIESNQSSYDDETRNAQYEMKDQIRKEKQQALAEKETSLNEQLPDNLKRAITLSMEKGASSWLTTLPLREHGFNLTKGEFVDAIHLRYGWPLKHLPSQCVCGNNFSVEHAFSCPCGGYTIYRHNDIRDATASMMAAVSRDVTIEPQLQPITGEEFPYRTANTEDDSRLDIKASGFWGDCHQDAFFDIRVFNPFASSNQQSSLKSTYVKHEKEKRRTYERRVIDVEHGSLTPLVFSACGGMGPSAKVTYSLIAAKLSEKRGLQYHTTINWIRCVLGFSLIKSAIRCIRGSRSNYRSPRIDTASIDLIMHDATSH